MILEFLRRRSVLVLAIGASLIVGFLSFSGMYVLLPILPLAIVAFVLSIAYEGEIYLQNIRGAFDKLFNPNYYKEQLATECLRELLPIIEEKALLEQQSLHFQKKTKEALEALLQRIEKTPRVALKRHYTAFLINYEKYISTEENKNQILSLEESILTPDEFVQYDEKDVLVCLNKVLSELKKIEVDKTQPFFKDLIRLMQIYHRYDQANLSHYELKISSSWWKDNLNQRTIHLSRQEGKIFYSLITPNGEKIHNQPTEIDAPQVFTLKNLKAIKAQILSVAQKNKHAHADHHDDKKKLRKSLQTLEQTFIDLLFEEQKTTTTSDSDKESKPKYIQSLSEFLNNSFALSALTEAEFTTLKMLIAPIHIKSANEKTYKTILFTKTETKRLKKILHGSKNKQLDQIESKIIVSFREDWKVKLKKRQYTFGIAQIFGGFSALFMMLGTSYLLVEAFSVFPFMAAISFSFWPVFIVPMAFVAGIAFGLLTYNAMTDMINDDLILKRYRKLKEDWSKGLTLKSGFMFIMTISLMVLAVALTICTAGTWWTVIKHTRPTFEFMRKIPIAVNAIAVSILGIASYIFNSGNTLESVEEIDESFDTKVDTNLHEITLIDITPSDSYLYNLFQEKIDFSTIQKPTLIKTGHQYRMVGSKNGKTWQETVFPDHTFDHIDFNNHSINFKWQHLFTYLTIKRYQGHTFIPSSKVWQQKYNPFSMILFVTYTPLRIVLFLGHLISIGVMADRLPGIPELLSALFGIVSEFFEDWHYFFSFKHDHGHDIQSLYDEYHEKGGGHDHTDDLPTRVLRQIFYPIIYLAAWWDHFFSEERSLIFEDALDKHLGLPKAAEITLEEEESSYILSAQQIPKNKQVVEKGLAYPIEQTTALEAEDEQPFLLDNLDTMASTQYLSKNSIFAECRDVSCKTPHATFATACRYS